MRYRKLDATYRDKVAEGVKYFLHASRDAQRNRHEDTTQVGWNVNDPYYAEAFGIIRCLTYLHYGFLGDDMTPSPHNLKFWFNHLCDEVLREEGFKGENKCDFCLEKFGKDQTRTGRPPT